MHLESAYLATVMVCDYEKVLLSINDVIRELFTTSPKLEVRPLTLF